MTLYRKFFNKISQLFTDLVIFSKDKSFIAVIPTKKRKSHFTNSNKNTEDFD